MAVDFNLDTVYIYMHVKYVLIMKISYIYSLTRQSQMGNKKSSETEYDELK